MSSNVARPSWPCFSTGLKPVPQNFIQSRGLPSDSRMDGIGIGNLISSHGTQCPATLPPSIVTAICPSTSVSAWPCPTRQELSEHGGAARGHLDETGIVPAVEAPIGELVSNVPAGAGLGPDRDGGGEGEFAHCF